MVGVPLYTLNTKPHPRFSWPLGCCPPPDPTPYTLHPTSYTLHPTPYTLHPTHILGCLDKGIQTPMAQGRCTESISMIKKAVNK